MATDLALRGPERATAWLQRDLRKAAAAATAGLLCGFVVNGIGSRLAMMLLARLNPHVTGRISDDSFRMGRFTLDNTTGLVVFATAVGVLGGLIFVAVRSLRFGPRWFRVASVSIGPAVVVGSVLVHTDGIDFHVLEPTWLAVALFVALPGLFALTVSLLTDRWTRPDAWAVRTQRAWLFGLAPLVLVLPAAPLVATGFVGRVLHQMSPALADATATRLFQNMARGLFVLLFSRALHDLVSKIIVLV